MGKVGRPVGQFDKSKGELLYLLKGLANLGCCFATTAYLAKMIGKSEGATKRYLRALKFENKIAIKSSRVLKDPVTGAFYKKRIIKILWPAIIRPAIKGPPEDKPLTPRSSEAFEAFDLAKIASEEIERAWDAMQVTQEQTERIVATAYGRTNDDTP